MLLFVFALQVGQVMAATSSGINIFLNVGSSWCGDGTVDTGEECDDGNNTNGDGCSSSCNIETTPTPTSTPPSNGGAGSIKDILKPLEIEDIFERVNTDLVAINWKTSRKAKCETDWGEEQDFLSRSTSEVTRKIKHKTYFDNLKSDKVYSYKIKCRDLYGFEARTDILQVKTMELVDEIPPSNIEDFELRYKKGKVYITWKNPEDADFQGVRILKSDEFFPIGFNSGDVIYNDRGTSTKDGEVDLGKRYYYTAYAYDRNNNHSSGAIAFIDIPFKKEVLDPDEEKDYDYAEDEIDEEYYMDLGLDFQDVRFEVARGTVELVKNKDAVNFLPRSIANISLSEEKTGDFLKSVILTITKRENGKLSQVDSYLMKSDGSRISANVIVPKDSGMYEINFLFVNYKDQRIYKFGGWINVLPLGQVFNTLIVDHFILEARASELKEGELDYVDGVKVTLFEYLEDGRRKIWDAGDYYQMNPLYTNKRGVYGFFVPNGLYAMKLEKDGYFSKETPLVVVEDNIVNIPIDMILIPRIDYVNLILLAFVSISVTLIILSIFKKQKTKKQKNILE